MYSLQNNMKIIKKGIYNVYEYDLAEELQKKRRQATLYGKVSTFASSMQN